MSETDIVTRLRKAVIWTGLDAVVEAIDLITSLRQQVADLTRQRDEARAVKDVEIALDSPFDFDSSLHAAGQIDKLRGDLARLQTDYSATRERCDALQVDADDYHRSMAWIWANVRHARDGETCYEALARERDGAEQERENLLREVADLRKQLDGASDLQTRLATLRAENARLMKEVEQLRAAFVLARAERDAHAKISASLIEAQEACAKLVEHRRDTYPHKGCCEWYVLDNLAAALRARGKGGE